MRNCWQLIKKQVIVGLAVLLLASFLLPVEAAAPSQPAEEIRGLIGLYEHGSEQLLIRERGGKLEMVVGAGKDKDEWLQHYAVYPLEKTGTHTYRLFSASPLGTQQGIVRFSRDAAGWGTVITAGETIYSRHFYGPEQGRDFRIKPLLPADQLRALAQHAKPPREEGIFLVPDLADITTFDTTIQLDIRYATNNNFMGMALYDESRALLQRPAAKALARAHWTLEKYGYGLIVYDAYRPWQVTKMFWDATPDNLKVFVADPANGSRHNRGGAVDVGLYDRRTGKPVAMISGYDEFSLRAFSTYAGGTEQERWLRDLLRIIMEGEGFTVYTEEWWHFDYAEWRTYPIMNIPFAAVR